jgi:galactitol-specific phosphotransferase system IIC component
MVTYSPLSTLGALALASSRDEQNKQKLFGQMLATGFIGVILGGLLGVLGFYNMF